MPVFRLNSGRFPDGLSIPSVVLAEASWYGSIRAGWTSASGPKDTSDAKHKGAGVSQFGSRWGIKGASEVSDGLSAVYRFETRIGEGAQTTDEIYVGLGGGFGTVSLGRQPSAGNVHVGFVDQSLALGSNELLTGDQGSKISYASPSIGGFSFQVDAQGDRSSTDKDVNSAQLGATLQLGENAKIGMAYVDRATKGKDNPAAKKDPGHYSASGALCDNPKMEGCTYSAGKAADPNAHLDDDRTAMIAGHYTLGGVSGYLGYGEQKMDTDSRAGVYGTEDQRKAAEITDAGIYLSGLAGGDLLDKKKKTTFFGFHGGIGDTGVNFFVQVRSNKTNSNKVKSSYQDDYSKFVKDNEERFAANEPNNGTYWINTTDGVISGRDTDESNDDNSGANRTAAIKAIEAAGLQVVTEGNVSKVRQPNKATGGTAAAVTLDNTAADNEQQTRDDRLRAVVKDSSKHTPFTLGVSRSLGGGASIHLEHANTDDDAKKNQTALILKVDF